MAIIVLFRETSNYLYTQGVLSYHNETIADTLEPTEIMLPPGLYDLSIEKLRKDKFALAIQDAPWQIGVVTTYKECHDNRTIGVGKRLIPGAMFKSKDAYNKLLNKVRMLQRADEKVELLITDTYCRWTAPIKHWCGP